jgi:hypothetical protein
VYPDFIRECPPCAAELRSGTPLPRDPRCDGKSLRELLGVLDARGGQVDVSLRATVVARCHRYTFPYFGFGFAWAHHMTGTSEDLPVFLRAGEIGMERRWSFPYLGRGFAWIEHMTARAGDCEFPLHATRVQRESRWRFPYQGYGYAWTAEMEGSIEDTVRALLIVSSVARRRELRFPYRGHGYAWEDAAVLHLVRVP